MMAVPSDGLEESAGASRVGPNEGLVAVGFLLTVLAVRLSTFFSSALDWDESKYVLMADQWLRGHPPYSSVWDNKPPGIYALFAAALEVFGHSMMSIRIVTCIFVFLTCMAIYKLCRLIDAANGHRVGFLAGLFYVVLSMRNEGACSNTEPFYIFFSVTAWYVQTRTLLLDPPARWIYWLPLAGVLFGAGFEIKYLVVVDLMAAFVAIGMLYWHVRGASRVGLREILLAVSGLMIAFLLPFAIATASYRWSGHFSEYWSANILANRARTVGVPFTIGPPAVASLQQVHDNPVLWLGVLGALVLLAVRKRAGKVQSPVLSTMVVWLGVNTVGLVVLFRGFLYQHYFQPLVPPAVVLAAWLFVALGEKLGRRLNLRVSPNAMFLAAVVLIPLVGAAGPLTLGAKHLYFLTIKHRQHWLDPEVEIADRIRPELKAGDTIYVVDGSPILYFLTDAELPTRYVFPPFLIKRVDMPDIMNVVPDEELSHIFAKRPRFVIKRHVDADPYYRPQAYQYLARVRECLSKGYQLKFSVDRDEVYELIDGQRSTCAS